MRDDNTKHAQGHTERKRPIGAKKRSAAAAPQYRVELIYAQKDASEGFGLLADLLLDEILRQRQATLAQQTSLEKSASPDGEVHLG